MVKENKKRKWEKTMMETALTFEKFIEDNDKLIWAVVKNKNGAYFDKDFYDIMLQYFETDDLYQECLMKLWNKFETFDGSPSKQSTYFVVILKNMILNLMKPLEAQRSVLTKTDYVEDIEIYQSWQEDEREKEKKAEIREYIETHKHKDILRFIIEGYTQTEIAKIKSVSKQYINKIYKDFVKEMKNELL